MTVIGELIAFLRTQLDEDERVAREATPGPWEAENAYHLERGCRCGSCYEDEPYAMAIHDLDGQAEDHSPFLKPGDAEHIARWDPARALTEVEAKRRVLDRCEYELRAFVGSSTQVALAHLVVKQFAQPYAEQPGWREEWSIGS